MISYAQSDQAILKDLGQHFRQQRLSRNLTQVELAKRGGLDPGVLRKIEAGKGYNITAFIGALRALELLEGLSVAVPSPLPSPLDLAKLKGHERERATAKRQRVS